jgi:hypothetical protein
MFGYAQFYGTKKLMHSKNTLRHGGAKDEILRYCTGKLHNNLQRLEAVFLFDNYKYLCFNP